MKNNEITIMKALGIIMVVMGHKYDPFILFKPYSFHMALFIFVSGYLYKQSYENSVRLFLNKRFKSLVVPYFLYNIFYALITYLIYRKYNILLGELPNFKNFFITPFVTGQQYFLFLPAWFMLQLFITQIVFLFIHKYIKKLINLKMVHLMIFTLLGVLGMYMARIGMNTGIYLIVTRSLFSITFFYYGHFFKEYLNEKEIYRTTYLFLVIALQVVLIAIFKDVTYEMVWSNFRSHIFLPIIVSCNGIYVLLFVSKSLSKILRKDDFIYKIGENSLHIMANHMFIFFLINYAFIKYKHINFLELSNIWYAYNVNKYWLLYISLGVIIPTIIPTIVKKSVINLEKDKLLKV